MHSTDLKEECLPNLSSYFKIEIGLRGLRITRTEKILRGNHQWLSSPRHGRGVLVKALKCRVGQPCPRSMLPTSLVLSLLFIVIPSTHSSQHPLFQLNTPRPVKLHLRHVHVASASGVLFADVTPELSSQQAADSDVQIAYTLDTIAQRTHRPSSLAAHAQARVDSMLRSAGRHNGSDAAGVLSWEEDVIVAPDVTSRETLLMLAKMTSNAYIYPEETGWYDLDGEWNVVSSSVAPSFVSREGSDTTHRAIPSAGKKPQTACADTSS